MVGAGAFGIVVACKDRNTPRRRRFALKIAAQNHPHAAAALLRERTMLSKMNHPNIIRVNNLPVEYKNLVMMRMELGKETVSSYVENQQKLTKMQGLPEHEAAKIMKGLLRALEYMHDDQNIIHRDIKPDNLILSRQKAQDLDKVKLIDFGLAVQDSLDTITDFAKCGTFLYKPPE